MFDLPFHPITVHFAIAVGFAVPVFGFGLWYAIKKNWVEDKGWRVVVGMAFLYTLLAIVTVQLGEVDEEKVEKIVAEDVIEHHEEAGEAIPWIAGILFVGALAGCRGKKARKFQLIFSIVATLALIPLGNAGHTGGELVYEYGAANAHLSPERWAELKSGVKPAGEHGDHDHDHDDDD
ncbi:MAG: hypothetical protein G3M70_02045 [Candidatus Nitronauta litoralis]|uniref:DUF2231 domain-containing protein n=1 Tax=Candidatus Nitronauta litoralis TaxID=2705533 RepID=A0A7T0BTQ2_9BACT|nr:MAG: hypothetical protein G3M70_02045 [Candidatus Nitronauta litoralis]